jgi:hypothetical protein
MKLVTCDLASRKAPLSPGGRCTNFVKCRKRSPLQRCLRSTPKRVHVTICAAHRSRIAVASPRFAEFDRLRPETTPVSMVKDRLPKPRPVMGTSFAGESPLRHLASGCLLVASAHSLWRWKCRLEFGAHGNDFTGESDGAWRRMLEREDVIVFDWAQLLCRLLICTIDPKGRFLSISASRWRQFCLVTVGEDSTACYTSKVPGLAWANVFAGSGMHDYVTCPLCPLKTSVVVIGAVN